MVENWFEMTVKKPSRAEAREKRKQEKIVSTSKPPLIARSESQKKYLSALATHTQVFGIGPEGTGKTYLAARWAIRQVIMGHKNRMVLSRPAVSKPKHRLGYRPGTENDKISDWLVPIMDAIQDECGLTTIKRMCSSGQIQFVPFETMMGRTFFEAVALLDEAQNCDFSDLRLWLTRQGHDTQCIVVGSLEQTGAIPDSGLAQIISMIDRYKLNAAVVKFDENSVVRSENAAAWVRAFTLESSYVEKDNIDGLLMTLNKTPLYKNGHIES